MEIIGQRLLKKEWEVFYPQIDLSQAKKIPAMVKSGNSWLCQRCGELSAEKVPAGFFYCPACLALGRIDSRSFLYYFPVRKLSTRKVTLIWKGELSAAQGKIAECLLQDQLKAQTFLLWAVTGAGKTEILFPLLKNSLERGRKIALTSPRIDVCNEVFLRFCQAFPQEKISLYHGQKRQDAGDVFVVCTVHQLLRYHSYFDLVIIDEVDAFPYAKDPLLHRAAVRSLKTTGKRVYLSATPDEQLKKTVDCLYYLPARYHRRSLPVPKVLFSWHLEKYLHKGCLPRKVIAHLRLLLEKNNVLLFCPSVSLLQMIANSIQKSFPQVKLTTVFSKDQERLLKVEQMRAGKYHLLLTTTILERGVTFEKVSVIVLQASHQIYSKAALVQMAGRADRKGKYTNAEVIFITSELTAPIKAAINEIKENNQKALSLGLIDEV
ncbi:helicase-related protein [Enterococcus dongliensis]|uniref:Helicase-related protein n=1 Tax=Enterococcus dongliensis TaxID=2559925 RepID=A0AAP5NGS3_9ENTE|nr:DEAD/DEAH box helicase [Enterococcus dongliensis]MDT2596556.1 helicase-related protein [Enterococcus dongliensis]MDT2603621.1 helicase-related protein [Enterococcus dongliensis]MDT2634458.1 helicase-related protein [Enterococcus dongliensis]MDT2637341.1 helicase-related protein [Enterococcus dongliensis]MDT2642567.1 helicase-related protein [Enterococcus dongliensis]